VTKPRVLLDSCLPQSLRHALRGHDVQTAQFAGVDGLLDKQLLDHIEGAFDVLLTCDQSLRWQQNMQGRPVSLIVMIAPSNRFSDLLPLVPELLTVLDDIQPGEVREVAG
jgi:hypothetical protein